MELLKLSSNANVCNPLHGTCNKPAHLHPLHALQVEEHVYIHYAVDDVASVVYPALAIGGRGVVRVLDVLQRAAAGAHCEPAPGRAGVPRAGAHTRPLFSST
jgi:hypothetical protein